MVLGSICEAVAADTAHSNVTPLQLTSTLSEFVFCGRLRSVRRALRYDATNRAVATPSTCQWPTRCSSSCRLTIWQHVRCAGDDKRSAALNGLVKIRRRRCLSDGQASRMAVLFPRLYQPIPERRDHQLARTEHGSEISLGALYPKLCLHFVHETHAGQGGPHFHYLFSSLR